MNDRPSQKYNCQCEGCPNGCGSVFEGAPADWFTERGMTSPKNCPDCRKWIKAQYDEATRCKGCNRSMRLSAMYKISHHKRTGPWVLPDQCRPCERGERPPRSTSERLPRMLREKPKQKKVSNFSEVASGIPVEPRAVTAEPADYQHEIWNRSTNELESRLTHLAHHVEGSPHSLVGQVMPGDNQAKSPSAFVGHDVDDERVLLANTSEIMGAVYPERMREYAEPGNKIVRLTLMGNGYIERTVMEPRPGLSGYRLVSTYDSVSVEDAIAKYKNR